ncbi:MAG: MFS transporter [Thermoleophilia bacterium]
MFAIDRRMKILTLGAMCFALFMAMLDNTVVNVALPKIQTHFGSGVSGLQWIISGYTLLFASLMLTGGTLGDLFGRKRTFLYGLTIFTAGSLLAGLAPSLTVLIGARAIQGLGAAALLPGTLSILTQTFQEPKERAQAIGIWAGISGVALAAGPIVGGALVDSFGWQSVFFLNIPIGIIAFFVASRVVHESKNPEGRHLDLSGQALAIVGLGSLTYALIEANNKGWGSPLIISLFAVAVVATAGFLWVELHSTSPMLQLSFFRNRTYAAAATVAGLVSFAMFGIFFFLTLFLQNVQGYSALGMGVRSLPMTGAIILTAPLAGQIASRVGSRVPMTIGLSLIGIGMLLMQRITPDMPYSSLWWNLMMMGIGMGLVMTPMTAAVMSAVPRARAGMASATTNASREVGGVFGIALLGAVVTHWFSKDLHHALTHVALPAQYRAQIITLAGHGGGTAAVATPKGVNAAALHHTIDTAFVNGMHAAFWVSAVALLAGALLTAVFVHGGVPAAEGETGHKAAGTMAGAMAGGQSAALGVTGGNGPRPAAPVPQTVAEGFAAHPPRHGADERT